MGLLHYQVDLQPYSGEQYEKYYDLLRTFCFTEGPFENSPSFKIRSVFWDDELPIEERTGIISSQIRRIP